MNTILVTYLYPKAIPYIPQLVAAINNQTDKRFNVLVFNDGVSNAERYFVNLQTQWQIIPIAGTIPEIRISSFDFLRQTKAQYFIFQDADDTMSENRVEIVRKYLENHDLVVNDLSLCNEKGDLIQSSIWSERLNNNFNFTASFIRDKNIVGLGNTAISRNALEKNLKNSDPQPLVCDWFLFYQVMVQGAEGIFTTSCQTCYRQYDGNAVGIREVDKHRVAQAIRVKLAHYHALETLGYNFKDESRALENMQVRLSSETLFKISTNTIPFWWEETNLYEKN
jgi:hypothetical protein